MKKRFLAIACAAALTMTSFAPAVYAADAAETAQEAVEVTADAAQEAVEEAADAAQEAADEAADAAQEAVAEAADTAQEAAAEAADAAQEAVAEAADAAQEAVAEAADAAAEGAQEAGKTLADAVDALADEVGKIQEELTEEPSAPAADSFSGFLSAKLDEAFDRLRDELKESKELPGGVTADLSVSIEDTAKALLGMFLPVDISWLKGADIRFDLGGKDSQGSVVVTASVNETPVVSLKALIDVAADALFVQVPDLFADTLTVSISELSEMAGAESSISEEDKALAQQVLANLSDVKFDPDAVIDFVDGFYDIAISVYEDQGSEEETITAGGISQQVTRLDAIMEGSNMLKMTQDLLIFFRDNKDVENLYTKAIDGIEDVPAFGDIQTMIDDALAELNSEAAAEDIDAGISLSMWVDESGEPVGMREIANVEDQNMNVEFYQTSDGDNKGFSMKTGDGENLDVSIEGTGVVTDGLLAGTYTVSFFGSGVASINVTDYDTEAAKEGYINGTYDISLSIPAEADENGIGAMLNSFGLMAKVASGKDGLDLDLSVTSEGVPLVTVGLDCAATDGVDGLDSADTEGSLNILEEGAMDQFLAGFNVQALLDKLTALGMPEDFLENAMQLFS